MTFARPGRKVSLLKHLENPVQFRKTKRAGEIYRGLGVES